MCTFLCTHTSAQADTCTHAYVLEVHVAKHLVCMSVSCMLHTFLKYRDHYTSNRVVAAPVQRCNYYVRACTVNIHVYIPVQSVESYALQSGICGFIIFYSIYIISRTIKCTLCSIPCPHTHIHVPVQPTDS